jgi:hypothetical protein
MPFTAAGVGQTCEIRRPFGGSVTTPSVSGLLMPRISGERVGGSPPPLYYTHVLMLDASVDIRDGCTRVTNSSQIAFGMGDEVRIPAGANYGSRYAVVWVERLSAGIKRVYLCRDAVQWGNVNAP